MIKNKYSFLLCFAFISPFLSMGQTAKEYYNTGMIKYNAKDYVAAIGEFTKALSAKPNYPEAFYYRGLSKFLIKDTGATADFTRAIALKPDYPKAYLYRGLVKFRLKGYGEAILDFNKAIELKPDLEDAYFYKGDSEMELKNYDSAISNLNKAIQLRPAYTGAIYTKGLTEFIQGKYDLAELDFTKTISLDSNYSLKLFYFRGLSRIELNKLEDACADFKKSLEAGYMEASQKVHQYCK